MWWTIGLVSNAIVAVAYLLIAAAITVPLVRSGQLRTNPLGAATAAIFFTCAVHHGGHSVHMLLPYAGVESARGLAMRSSFDWEMATWDVITATIGVYYWTLRRTYAPLMRGAKLFEDMRQREQQALELNDNVLQGLVVTRMALELDQPAKAREALESAIGAASHMITDLLEPEHRSIHAGLLRSAPAHVTPDRPPDHAADMPVPEPRSSAAEGAAKGPVQ
jgi:hypothetical protein